VTREHIEVGHEVAVCEHAEEDAAVVRNDRDVQAE
jgi:hypothetical protein